METLKKFECSFECSNEDLKRDKMECKIIKLPINKAFLKKGTNCSEKVINILGYKYVEVENSELIKILRNKNVNVNICIDKQITDNNVKRMSISDINLVMKKKYALVAKYIQKNLGIEYMIFDEILDIDKIDKYYENISCVLGVDIKNEVMRIRQESMYKINQYKLVLKGKRFIINDCICPMKISKFLMDFGMIPFAIRCEKNQVEDESYMRDILSGGYNPYILNLEEKVENMGSYVDSDILVLQLDNDFTNRGYQLLVDILESVALEYLNKIKHLD